MKNRGINQFIVNLLICVISTVAIIVFKLIYYDSFKQDIFINGDVSFLMASTVGSTMAWRMSEQSGIDEKSKNNSALSALTIFSIVICVFCIVLYGVGILYSGEVLQIEQIENICEELELKNGGKILYVKEHKALIYLTYGAIIIGFIEFILESIVALRLIKKHKLKDVFRFEEE